MSMTIFNPDLVKSIELGSSAGTSFNPEKGMFPAPAPAAKGPTESSFEQALKDTVARVNDTQNSADQSVQRLAAGQEANIHHTMLELEQADISLKLAMQVRSKVLDAYQEIMRMQV